MTNTPSKLSPVDDGGPAYPVLTKREQRALSRLAELREKYPANDFGFLPSSLGASAAAAARRLEARGFGLIKIDRIAENCFRYAITDKGYIAVAALLTARKGGGERV